MNYDITRKVQEALAEHLREAFPDIPVWTDEPMTERDTHFQKFAELLLEELGGDIAQLMDETADSGDYEGHMRLIIAQRAYDLVIYALQHDWYCHAPDATIQSIPDLTAWTEPPTTAE